MTRVKAPEGGLSMNKLKVYISIPIARYDYEAQKKIADKAKEWLERNSMEAVSPFENGLNKTALRHEHMQRDIQMLLECDAIMPIGSWQSSRGCKLEMEIAKQTDKTMILAPWAIDISKNIREELPF